MSIVLDSRMRQVLSELRKLERNAVAVEYYLVCMWCGSLQIQDRAPLADLELLSGADKQRVHVVPSVNHACTPCLILQRNDSELWDGVRKRTGRILPEEVKLLAEIDLRIYWGDDE